MSITRGTDIFDIKTSGGEEVDEEEGAEINLRIVPGAPHIMPVLGDEQASTTPDVSPVTAAGDVDIDALTAFLEGQEDVGEEEEEGVVNDDQLVGDTVAVFSSVSDPDPVYRSLAWREQVAQPAYTAHTVNAQHHGSTYGSSSSQSYVLQCFSVMAGTAGVSGQH
jgi:hypothetical protein